MDIIKNAIIANKYTHNATKDINSLLENMKDKDNINISKAYKYKVYNKFKKEEEDAIIWIIMNKEMSAALKNNNIYQYFGDATYRCVPPTFRKYRLYIISGFDLTKLKTKLLTYILIPNETKETYFKMFQILKENYGFNPYIFTSDFNKASNIALKKVFPNVFIIKCFFHFVQSIWKNLKKFNLTDKTLMNTTKELSFNIKKLAFIEPADIPKSFKIIKKKYSDKKYIEFFKYFIRQWKPDCKYNNINFNTEWNFYHVINSIEFDVKHLYFTNNIAEHINKLLNSNLKTKYPTFDNWQKALLTVEKIINDSSNKITRYDYITKILLYYINLVKENKINKEILDIDDINRLNSIIFPETNISNLFTVSKYFNIENEEFNENEYLNLKEERDESSEESSSEMKDEDTEKFKDPKNDNNKIIFDRIKEKKDFSFNLEQCVNSIDLNVSKLELNKDINDNLKFK